jgi:hypothetical protein
MGSGLTDPGLRWWQVQAVAALALVALAVLVYGFSAST